MVEVHAMGDSETEAYAPIVGAGPNSTALHYDKLSRKIQDGDIVVMDVGAQYSGYAADIRAPFRPTENTRLGSARFTTLFSARKCRSRGAEARRHHGLPRKKNSPSTSRTTTSIPTARTSTANRWGNISSIDWATTSA